MSPDLLQALTAATSPDLLALITVGVVLGVIVGAIPGLNGAILVALSLPLTFGWSPTQAISLLVGMYVGSISGGLISSTLLEIPGSPSNLMTLRDAAPMAKAGHAERALQLGVLASLVGGTLSWVALVYLSPPLASVALAFGPHEYFALVLAALALITTMSEGSRLRAIVAGLLGMFAALPGLDPVTAEPRLTFGFDQMLNGFDLLAVLVGLLAVTQLLADTAPGAAAERIAVSGKAFALRMADTVKHGWGSIQASIIGVLVGILPGVGGSVGSIAAYSAAQAISKEKDKFGKGSEEGIVASEAANNATVGGALIPLVTMGVPGSVINVIMLAALILHDIRPGPLLFSSNPDIVYCFMSSLFIANVVMAIFMLIATAPIARLMNVPKKYLTPVLLMVALVGVFAINNRMFDVWVMIAFGLIGLLFRAWKLPAAPFVIGFILTPMAEQNLRAGLIASGGDLVDFATRPIALALLILSALIVLGPLVFSYLKKQGKN